MNFIKNTIMFIKRFKYLTIIVVAVALFLGFYPKDAKKDQVLMGVVYQMLNNDHYQPQNLNDDFSKKLYEDYLETMDFSKRFLLQSDVDLFNTYSTRLDDDFKSGNFEFFDKSFEIIDKRIDNVKAIYQDVLSKPFDYTVDETYEVDAEKLAFAKSEAELKEHWRKYLKYRTLQRITEKLDSQENRIEDDDETIEQESSKDDDLAENKSFEEIEKEAREKELETHDKWFERMDELERRDWLSMYINTIAGVYDPHTAFYPPKEKEDFDISISGQLEGIGAQLTTEDGYITVAEVITGSPSWKQGDLEAEDKILKVGQGDEEPVDVVGMRIDDAVRLIRGKKGTEVRLTVKKIDGSIMVIPIIRDVVVFEETFAKSAIIEKDGERIGYIKLPKFYVNFNDRNAPDCADDVAKELEKLKEEGIDGLVFDLRNNGGGTLQGAIDIVGLFIKNGPVVQVLSSDGSSRVLRDRDSRVQYDGPLVVMVNSFSASASEIFAAAIQDYNRGIIVGSKTTFGKGTVQTVLDLDRVISPSYNDVKPLGGLKLTYQKFYRVNGGATQLKGVESDVVFPDRYSYLDFGEKDRPNALKWDEIKEASYDALPENDAFEKVIDNSEDRIKDNDKFSLIDEHAKWLKKQQDNTIVSLRLEDYRAELKKIDEMNAKFKGMKKSDEDLTILPLKVQLPTMQSDTIEARKINDWHKSLKKDLYLTEAATIAEEL